ncbi:MAG: hypothetical protein AAF597_13700, partial [Bacteroidota bacterium]
AQGDKALGPSNVTVHPASLSSPLHLRPRLNLLKASRPQITPPRNVNFSSPVPFSDKTAVFIDKNPAH